MSRPGDVRPEANQIGRWNSSICLHTRYPDDPPVRCTHEAVCQVWTKKPQRFRIDPSRHTPELNTGLSGGWQDYVIGHPSVTLPLPVEATESGQAALLSSSRSAGGHTSLALPCSGPKLSA